ncbi:ribbon-helix-helix domain-containing protein [Priestia megaterium]|uniref:ribbon-helix-helix domain-containing protein n=1 Tax=Priestia megaterium TaxID=1404 RepID=UPI000CA34687|nr:type II toxin-antitoxin system HicB family antitoxin [Priestia megaterium]AUO14779.1 DNA-binding protein [Priestia megaterium]
MAISKQNSQVYITLPKEVVDKVDKEAKREMRTRSKQLAKIILDYYNQKED